MKLVNYWDKYTEMHGQQNAKTYSFVQFTFVALDIIVLNGTKPLRSCLSLMLKRASVSCETQRFKILYIKLVNYWDKYTEMHGQQNVKN